MVKDLTPPQIWNHNSAISKAASWQELRQDIEQFVDDQNRKLRRSRHRSSLTDIFMASTQGIDETDNAGMFTYAKISLTSFLAETLNFFRPRVQFNQVDTVGVWEGQWNRRDEGELWIPPVQIQLPEERPSQTDRGDQRDEAGPRAGSQWDWAGWLDQCDAELQQGLSGAIFAQEKTYRR